MLKTVALVTFLKTENLTWNVLEFFTGQALIPFHLLSHADSCTLSFRINLGVFFVFENLTSVTVFDIKSPNLRHQLTFTCTFHF